MAKLASFFGHRARELPVHIRRLTRHSDGRRRVVIFPGESATGSASDLRATAF
jgi:hypothetical protein